MKFRDADEERSNVDWNPIKTAEIRDVLSLYSAEMAFWNGVCRTD